MDKLRVFLGGSSLIRQAQHRVNQVSENRSPVLIVGESGTGKDVVAQIIHDNSSKQNEIFTSVKILTGEPEPLELKFLEFFDKENKNLEKKNTIFKQLANTTLYIENIERLSAKTQNNFLRAIEEGAICSPNEASKNCLGARLIFSTSFDSSGLKKQFNFNEYLLQKLVFGIIYLPSLRERREDIQIIFDDILEKFNKNKIKKITNISYDAMNAILSYSWTNNIQEFENTIERILSFKESGTIEVCDLPPKIRNLITNNIDEYYRDKKILNHNDKQKSMINNSEAPLSHNIKSLAPKIFSRSRTTSVSDGESFLYDTEIMLAQNPITDVNLFIKKEIDLGLGIDFYKIVEDFENKLIAEALRRTNQNKNRAAHLLSMNRTTLVEKLKKRHATSSQHGEFERVKKTSAFTIFDGLGTGQSEFERIGFGIMATEKKVISDIETK